MMGFRALCLSVFAAYFLWTSHTHAQTYDFRWDSSPKVKVSNQVLQNPWAGGLNGAQFSKMNLDNDALEDLVVFDRASHQVMTFLAVQQDNQIRWQHAPRYEARFPADLLHWMLLVDYDRDGRKDLFTSAIGGIRVFRNILGSEGFTWQKVADPLQTQGFSGRFNLYVQSTDLPAITDVDDDGDVDILAFDFSGNTIELHQNFSVEQKSTDPFVFRKVITNWGRFFKEHCNDFAFDQDPITLSTEKFSNARIQHAGNAIWVGDLNGDGRKDLLHGHVTCTNLAKLNNTGGNGLNARMTSFDKLFPLQNPVDFQVFPSAYIEDLDGDGRRDMVVSPSSLDYAKNPLINLRQSNWFYRNEGTDAQPNFVLKNTDFLQNTMLDLGQNAVPALADADGDGDLDLWVGHAGTRTERGYRSSIWFFQNTGSPTQAQFELVTTDFLSLSEKIFTKENLLLTDTKPFFADLNGDGSLDMGFWANTFKGMTVRYLPNAAARGRAMMLDAEKQITLPNPPNFVNGENLLFYDFDRDGKLDLLVAKNTGNVEQYRNVGTPANPQHERLTEKFGGIDVDFEKRAQGMAVADLNGDRKPELVMGDLMGTLRVYRDFAQPNATLKPDSSLIFNEFLNKTQFQKVGMEVFPALGDLDGDGLPELLAGVNGGGLRLLKNTSLRLVPTPEQTELIVYPNPTAGFLYIQNPTEGRIELINVAGQLLGQQTVVKPTEEASFDLSRLPAGVYFVRLIGADSQTTRKVIVAR
ncbi:MAG: T9SS type A sorting domain-containing protein [Spirosomaceae bacterium]|nr:T9SS type A sorting domain-containing protein [Spirosomataceae bacterium]